MTRAIATSRQQRRETRGIKTTKALSVHDFYKQTVQKKRPVKRAKHYYDKVAMTLGNLRDGARSRNTQQSKTRTFEEDYEDDLAIIVKNDEKYLSLLKEIYDAACPNPPSPDVLRCLARLQSAIRAKDSEASDDALETVALYIAKGLRFRSRPVLDKERRLSLSYLVTDESVDLEAVILFLCRANSDVPRGLESDNPNWWELRALISAEKYKICNRANSVASAIVRGASHVESGLQTSTGWVCSSVCHTGGWVRSRTPDFIPTRRDRDQVVQLTYTDAARRASFHARERTRNVMDSLLDASGAGIAKAHEGLTGNRIVPPWAEAVGQVGMAGLGAAVIVGETAVSSTREIVQTTAKVTADIVEQKYGPTAGQSVRDCTETVGNTWLAAQSALTLLSPTTWTRVVARHGCKQHLREQQNLRRNGAGARSGASDNAETEALFDHALAHFIL